MEGEKVWKWVEDSFFFLFFSFVLVTFWNHLNCLGSTKMHNFYREKSYFLPVKNRETDFGPSEKYSSYATGIASRYSWCSFINMVSTAFLFMYLVVIHGVR